MKENDLRFAKLLVLVNAAVPAVLLGWDAWHHQLGANPVNFAILTTGMLALIFLLLTLLASGIYGRALPPQDGAPIRLVVPWKYGFKGIKSIVKIKLVATQPRTTWSEAAPNEYGFYGNVNPQVDHPRWSQATEQRIGESGRRATLMFNGYAEQVAHLYAGMDLRANF